ncbi:MAG: CehA/McbA family metallohydrolase [Akkermansiaceae bacterium]|nr:CehA/McbA family metallohydrolase [Akkermansiaceae bacterium]
MKILSFAAICGAVAFVQTLPAAETFEIGEHNFEELPRGKEADGIVGDFVIRNDRIEAVISGNLPERRANMSTFYGDGGETPGCLYDLTVKGANNDQITIFTPLGQRGPVNYVRVVKDGSEDGEAILETFVSAAKAGGVSRRHTYRLKDGWRGLLITSTLRNEGAKPGAIKLADGWTQMRSKGTAANIDWADAIDPADKCGYAADWVDEDGAKRPAGTEVTLKPGEEIVVARFIAVAASPAEAAGIVAARQGETGTLKIALKDDAGKPVSTGQVKIDFGGGKIAPAYPDDAGLVTVSLPAGKYPLAIEDIGRSAAAETVEIAAGAEVSKSVALGPQSAVSFSVTDTEGVSTPCKAQFNAIDGTEPPVLGPTDRAHGAMDQYFSEKGAFRVPLPPGKYRVVVTHGPEFSHHDEIVTLAPGQEAKIAAKLERLVDTAGWVSTDYHNHSTPSGDNTCGTADRLVDLAAEQIEFAPTTEHNRLFDWEPLISDLGLAPFLKTVAGMELTGRGAHFNCFPLKPDPRKQDGGAPVWKKDPRLNAITLRDWQNAEPDRWIHVNHPDMIENFVDRNGDGRADGGYAYFGGLLDGLETQNYSASEILAGAPYKLVQARGGLGRQVMPIREFIWLQLLNQGLDVRAIAVTDSHQVFGNGVGGWRTYVKSGTDDPARIDWRELSRNSKAGRMILSTGPFLEVETGAGVEAGGLDRVSGELKLKVRVQCTDWLDIDRVQVLVNGRQPAEYNYTRRKNPDLFADGVVKFDQTLTLNLSQDAHVIVVAIGENFSLAKGFGGSAQASIRPIAYNNPIYVDVDGGGFRPNGDTLGFDLPVAGLSVDEVKARLGEE